MFQSLDCNLISVAQLLDKVCCMVPFTKKICVVHDLTAKNLIRVGEPRRGVLVYKADLRRGFKSTMLFLKKCGIAKWRMLQVRLSLMYLVTFR